MSFSLQNILDQLKIPIFLRNKYILGFLIFFIWVAIFDGNNLIQRISDSLKINQLKQEIEYYKQKIDEKNKQLNQLRTDKENLEKFAREQYFMKKENEEIFIIVETEKNE